MQKIKAVEVYEEVTTRLELLGSALSSLCIDLYQKCEASNRLPTTLIEKFMDSYENLFRYEMLRNVNPKFSTATQNLAQFIINRQIQQKSVPLADEAITSGKGKLDKKTRSFSIQTRNVPSRAVASQVTNTPSIDQTEFLSPRVQKAKAGKSAIYQAQAAAYLREVRERSKPTPPPIENRQKTLMEIFDKIQLNLYQNDIKEIVAQTKQSISPDNMRLTRTSFQAFKVQSRNKGDEYRAPSQLGDQLNQEFRLSNSSQKVTQIRQSRQGLKDSKSRISEQSEESQQFKTIHFPLNFQRGLLDPIGDYIDASVEV